MLNLKSNIGLWREYMLQRGRKDSQMNIDFPVNMHLGVYKTLELFGLNKLNFLTNRAIEKTEKEILDLNQLEKSQAFKSYRSQKKRPLQKHGPG